MIENEVIDDKNMKEEYIGIFQLIIRPEHDRKERSWIYSQQ